MYSHHTLPYIITKIIPGHTPGAGKCKVCERPAMWQSTKTETDENNNQRGIRKQFFCDVHKPINHVE